MTALAIVCTILAVLILVAWGVPVWVEERDAHAGPPPTRRPARPTVDDLMPLGLESGVEEYAARWDAAAEAARLEHVAEALVLAQRDGVVVPMQRRPGGAS